MGCNELSYSFSFVSTPLDPDELCTQTEYGSLMWSFYQNKYPPQHVRTLLKIKSNISDDAEEYCRKNLEYRAEVIFRMAIDSMPVTVMSSRLSFFDKMSAFGKCLMKVFCFIQSNFFLQFLGGTLGLFTGISILSMMEVVFWIFRYFGKNTINSCKMGTKT